MLETIKGKLKEKNTYITKTKASKTVNKYQMRQYIGIRNYTGKIQGRKDLFFLVFLAVIHNGNRNYKGKTQRKNQSNKCLKIVTGINCTKSHLYIFIKFHNFFYSRQWQLLILEIILI